MELQIHTYEQLDREIKRTMKRSADDLVKMGYLLRQMQEGHLWEGRFSCLDEYLDQELHMDYTMATRFIKANKKYSSDTDNMKIDTKWSEFSQSVLIEMLNMPPELEEKVTPDMTVKQVREVKKQKNVKMKPDVRGLMDDPYCAVCGEPLDSSRCLSKCPGCGQVQDWEWYNRTFGDDGRTKETVIDGEYREIPEKKSAYGLPKTEYPEGSLLTTEGCGHLHDCFQCARECEIRQKERYCREAMLGNPYGCQTMEKLKDIEADRGNECQFINLDLACKTVRSGEPDPCCKECTLKDNCDFCCDASRRHNENVATSQDSAPTECDEEAETVSDSGLQEEKQADDMAAIRSILIKEQDLLSEYKALGGIPERTVYRQKIIVAALAAMICDLEREQEQEQPELPILKNERQRKEWLNSYKTWGLWYRDENIDVNYYKFDFEDGSRLIVSEYPQRLPSYSIKKKDIHCYHLLVKDSGDFRGRKFNELYCPDSDLELYLTEFLKDLQKKGGRKT